MKIRPLRRSQYLVIWLGLLPVLLALLSYRTSAHHVASVRAALATEGFIRRLDELFSSLQDAETGQRGFILTGQESYLEPFKTGQGQVETRLSAIEKLASANGVPAERMREVRHLIALKLSELNETVELRKNVGFQAALAEVDTHRGQEYMNQIRSALQTIKSQQTEHFEDGLERERASQQHMEMMLTLGAILAFLLVFLSYRFSALYVSERDLAEREVRELNNTLEARVKERTVELEARTQDLERRTAELARSNADLVQFAYVASHDLQEPLRMVSSYVELLSRRYHNRLDETAQKYIDFASSGANRMQTLIQDLLAYSRAGTQALEKVPVSSAQVLERALQNLAVSISETSTRLHIGELPMVEADETKLTLVMQNLVGNAIKFRKPDTVPEISVTATKQRNEWVFRVADNGIGFDPKYCDRIFQVFQRLHGTGKYPGNGIGLAICRRIIEHHGGQLWAHSQPDVGSEFFFTLPFATDLIKAESDVAKRTETKGASQSATHACS